MIECLESRHLSVSKTETPGINPIVYRFTKISLPIFKEVYSMPNIKSAVKRVKVSEKRRLRNKMLNSRLKTTIKSFNLALTENRVDDAKANFPKVVKTIDMAVTKGILHKNTAARKKSTLQRALNQAVNA